MDQIKIGALICTLRKEKHMTQKQVANQLNISDKAVSKWERGLGFPDVSLLSDLAMLLEINVEALLVGELDANKTAGGNMKKIKFYVCPTCANLITSTNDATISCCGKNLQPAPLEKAKEDEMLSVEKVETDYFISTEHEQSKQHYIAFLALVTGDSIMLKKQYPEWTVQTRLPAFSRGMLVWYCTQHGLKYQLV